MNPLWNNIPEELRLLDQWVLHKEDKTPVNCEGIAIDPTNPSNWLSFACAVECAPNFAGIGFAFKEGGEYVGIDLDNPYKMRNGQYVYSDPDQQLAVINKIFETFPSYSEKSPSGNGAHIIVRGKIPSNAKPSDTPVELYSSKRYFTFTADVLANRLEIIDANPNHLELLYKQLKHREPKPTAIVGRDEPATRTDNEVMEICAKTYEAFVPLYRGELCGHPSHSECDLHLINLLGHKTQNREQIRRIWRSSWLGQRPSKANRPELLEQWIDMSFDQLPPPVTPEMLEAFQLAWNQSGTVEAMEQTPTAPESVNVDDNTALTAAIPSPRQSVYTFPPGLLGDIARFIYAQSPRPVPEISLAGAIGFMAGICGNQYNIYGEGLNYYVLVLARSGRGKEAMRSGINKIVKAVDNANHGALIASKFIGPGDMASNTGLIRHMGKQGNSTSIVSILGEFGLKLQQLADPRANGTEKMLQKLILEIYHMSGPAGILMPTVYADVKNNTEPVNSPAFSIIGETTFERFRVDETIINDGLIPRFSIIEYRGPLTPFNENCNKAEVPDSIVEEVRSLCTNSLSRQRDGTSYEVPYTDEAWWLFQKLNSFVETKINRDDVREAYSNIWNRTHIRAMKLAAMVAVGINKYNPIIDGAAAQWAIDFVMNDGRILHEGLEQGGIGHFATESVENECLIELTKQIAIYLIEPFRPTSNKAAIKEEHDAGMFRASYLQSFVTKNKRFQDREGKTKRALYETLDMLAEYGYIELVATNKAKTYRVLDKSYFDKAYAKYTRGRE